MAHDEEPDGSLLIGGVLYRPCEICRCLIYLGFGEEDYRTHMRWHRDTGT